VLALALPPTAGAATARPVSEVVRIPLASGHALGVDAGMIAGVFRPAGDGPFPVVVYSHGRSGAAERSATEVPEPWGFVRYWVRKGFAVVAPIRPGYGATGGEDREDSGVSYDVFGNCWGRPQFARAAAAAREAVGAAVAWARAQPWAEADRIVLMGTSMGGLASLASGAVPLDGVVATINFAGGTGGNGEASPEHSCGAEAMEELMAAYGVRTRVPSLWLYARNDSFWGIERPQAWFRAYARGNRDSRLVLTDAVPGADGHQLLGRGSRLWIPPVDRFLADHGWASTARE